MVIDQNGQPLQPQQPTFPITSINIPQDGSGMEITIMLAPGMRFAYTIGPDMLHQICKQWLQTCKNVQDQMRVIEHVKSTKLK